MLTSGFAANNISESYDAKIFAVSTLLSSYLIYNSVKVCDTSDQMQVKAHADNFVSSGCIHLCVCARVRVCMHECVHMCVTPYVLLMAARVAS